MVAVLVLLLALVVLGSVLVTRQYYAVRARNQEIERKLNKIIREWMR